MCVIFKPEFYSRSYRCICQDIRKANWKWICLSLIVFALGPICSIIIICAIDDIYLRLGCGTYLLFTLMIARFFIKPSIKRAIAEMKAARRQGDQEASISLQTFNPPPAQEAQQGVSTLSWFIIPHRKPIVDEADDDILERVRDHNKKYSHPVFDHPIAETSFIQPKEDSEEGASAPHVTHRSRHPSSMTDEPSSSSTLFVTTVEGVRPPPADSN